MTAIITIETRTAAEIADDLSEILQGDLARLEAVPSLLQAIAAQLPALYQMRDMERAGSEAIDAMSRIHRGPIAS